MRLVLLVFLLSGCARTIVAKSPVEAKEAVLVLPGLGYATEGAKDMKRFAKRVAREGYDVYVPHVVKRDGIDESVAALGRYVKKRDLARYEKVHVVGYILGGVMLNRWLEENEMPNLATIVYDRSPLQERAPALSVQEIPTFSRIFIGRVIFELAKTPWPSLERDVPIGLVIENHATWFLRRYEKQARAMGPIDFAPESLGQSHADYFYVWLDHFEMYHRFGVFDEELLHFWRHGRFSASARRVPFDKDPFSK